MSFPHIQNEVGTPLLLKRESAPNDLSAQANAATVATVRALKASPCDHQSADEERLYSKIRSSKKEEYEAIGGEEGMPKPKWMERAVESANTLVSKGFFLWASYGIFS